MYVLQTQHDKDIKEARTEGDLRVSDLEKANADAIQEYKASSEKAHADLSTQHDIALADALKFCSLKALAADKAHANYKSLLEDQKRDREGWERQVRGRSRMRCAHVINTQVL